MSGNTHIEREREREREKEREREGERERNGAESSARKQFGGDVDLKQLRVP